MDSIGPRIRAKRQELGYSQDELAKKMGYKSRSAINKIELGINDITQSKVVEFAKVLDTTVGYLMGWTDVQGNQDLGLTALDIAKWINASPSEVDAVMSEMNWPDITNPEILSRVSAEVQRRKLSASVDELPPEHPDIRMIARAGKKMTPEQAENLRKYAQYMFPEAFKDDDT